MSRWYRSFIALLALSIFVFVVLCYLLEIKNFDGQKIYGGKEISTNDAKCTHLREIAIDMLSNGERVALPYETNNTRWTFHRRGNLNYLMKTTLRWRWRNFNLSSFYFQDYADIKSKDIKRKKYFITFAHGCCNKSKVRALKSALDPGGFDFATAHDMNYLSEKFRHTHSAILTQSTGGGFWLWKPYIILKTLIERMSDNDLLMYQDADSYLVDDAGPLLKLCQDLEAGVLVFHSRYLEKKYSKRDAFILMDMDDERVYDSYQRMGGFVVLRKNCQSLQFIMEWLAYAMDPRILTDIPNQMGKPNHSVFFENRHDQTVISLLSKKWQLDDFRNPCTWHRRGNLTENSTPFRGPYRKLLVTTKSKAWITKYVTAKVNKRLFHKRHLTRMYTTVVPVLDLQLIPWE